MFKWMKGAANGSEAVAAPEQNASCETLVKSDKSTAAFSLRKACAPLAVAETKEEFELESAATAIFSDCEKIISSPNFDLPMLPDAAMRITELVQDRDVSLNEIAKAVTQDPVLAAKFLRMANSSAFAQRRQVESVQHAVTCLGLYAIKSVVMSIALHGTIFKDKRLQRTAERLWNHSLGCAAAAKALAPFVNISPERAYMAGLLHDIGKIPALLFVQSVMKPNQMVRPEFMDALVERFHVRSGIALQSHWKLPLEARVIMATHHTVSSVEEAMSQVALRARETGDEERKELALILSSVIVADRALASIGAAEEPGEVDIIGLPLAEEIGLSSMQATEYLQNLPERLAKLNETEI